ncbi:MAG: IS5 family transposase [Opitutaceae bacterium]
MKPKPRLEKSSQLFQQDLEHLLDQRQALYKLSNRLPWDKLEKSFECYYKDLGRPALPTRLMAGLLLLKQLENLSDERVCEAWQQNPYMQYFCGERYFQWKLPCEPSELVHFRNRIGQEGVEKILKMTVELHADKVAKEEELVADTTVQEANVKFPTDTRLYVDCIEKLWRMGELESVKWRRSYVRTVPQKLARLRTRSNRLVKERKKCRRKLKTIAGRLLRDFKRKIDAGVELEYADELGVIERVLQQQRHDKNKVYSLHDPDVLCIAKGKAHKKYEFGRKASVTMLRDSGVIVSAVSYEENLYDGDTLAPALEQAEAMSGKTFESVLVDKGYRGRKKIGDTDVVIPGKISKRLSAHHRRKQRKRFGRRAAIEPVIGHLKSDYRMARCYLKGAAGVGVNLGLAAAAWNIKKWINELLFALILWLDSKRTNFGARHLNQEYASWRAA